MYLFRCEVSSAMRVRVWLLLFFQTFTCFEMGHPLSGREVFDYCWSLSYTGEWLSLCHSSQSNFYYSQLGGLLMWGILFDNRQICYSQLLLALTSIHSFLGFSLTRLMTIFYCHRFKSLPIWMPGPCISIPQKQGGPCMHPGTGFPVPSLMPPMICKAMMEAFKPTSTWEIMPRTLLICAM
jgi:hypothetical protein